MLHRSPPREFGKESSLWTLEFAAEASFERGLTEERVSGETIRATLARLEVRWMRAKKWITSPDPEYDTRKRGSRPTDPPGRGQPRVGLGFRRRDLWWSRLWLCPRCTAGARREGPCAWCSGGRSPKTIPTPKLSPAATGSIFCPSSSRDVAALRRRRPPGERHNHAVVPRVELPKARRCGQESTASSVGQRQLAQEQGSALLDGRAQPRGVKKSGRRVRIVVCLLPKQSPWLNPIEPK